MYSIILVDDDRFVSQQIKESLDWEALGFAQPELFTSAEDALAHIKTTHTDAVITDIKMNKMSGLELAEICSRQYPRIKVAIMSAYRDFEYARTAMKFGVNEYIVKPIIYSELRSAVRGLRDSLDSGSSQDISSPSDRDAILSAVDYMNKHISEQISLNDVAKHVGFHPNYFSIYFKQNTDENFSVFLTKLRISKAKQLLKCTDYKISAICEMVGYKNQTHFYNLFKEYNGGITPLQFRTKNKGE